MSLLLVYFFCVFGCSGFCVELLVYLILFGWIPIGVWLALACLVCVVCVHLFCFHINCRFVFFGGLSFRCFARALLVGVCLVYVSPIRLLFAWIWLFVSYLAVTGG